MHGPERGRLRGEDFEPVRAKPGRDRALGLRRGTLRMGERSVRLLPGVCWGVALGRAALQRKT